jgi:hypothetical protein
MTWQIKRKHNLNLKIANTTETKKIAGEGEEDSK